MCTRFCANDIKLDAKDEEYSLYTLTVAFVICGVRSTVSVHTAG